MALTSDQKTKIVVAAKKVIASRLASFPDDNTINRNAPFHSAFLKAFEEKLAPLNISNDLLLALGSWIIGLNTSLGQSFLESTAFILSGGSKKSFKKPAIKSQQAQIINEISAHFKNGTKKPNVKDEDEMLLNIDKNDRDVDGQSFSADVLFERGNDIIAVELKSVRVNSGEGSGEKRKMLVGKAHLQALYPTKKIRFFIGFPFDPTASSFLDYDKDRYLNYLVEFKKYFDKDEILLGPELWDYLSGQENTMQEILDLIQEAVESFN